MKYEVIATAVFEKKLKRVSKKYKSLPSDLVIIIDNLTENQVLGISIGKDCLK